MQILRKTLLFYGFLHYGAVTHSYASRSFHLTESYRVKLNVGIPKSGLAIKVSLIHRAGHAQFKIYGFSYSWQFIFEPKWVQKVLEI